MESHFVLNSNPWFSAVSDYCLQLSIYLSGRPQSETTVAAPMQSLMHQKCRDQNLNSCVLNMSGLAGVVAIWKFLNAQLKKQSTKQVVWVFEGREHLACTLHKLVMCNRWQNTKLIRIRGQTVDHRKSSFQLRLSQWIYSKSDIVFAAKVIQDHLPRARQDQLICHYGRAPAALFPTTLPPYWKHIDAPHSDNTTLSKKNLFTYLIVGRFDPVKGHASLLNALCRINFPVPTQLICIGESQNISAQSLANQITTTWKLPTSSFKGTPGAVSFQNGNTHISIVDGREANIPYLMSQADCGVISSLGSEVICRVAVEFLQAGTPLVSSKAGALCEILTGAPAIFYNDEKDLCDTLLAAQTQFSKSVDLQKQCVDFALERYSPKVYEDLLMLVMSRWSDK